MANKFKTSLVSQVKAQEATEQEQKVLHKKHNIEDENVIVVEKSNMTKFLISTIGGVIRTFATIVLLILAVIGLTAIIYPEPRADMIDILFDLIKQIKHLF